MSIFRDKKANNLPLTIEIPRTKLYDYNGKLYDSEKTYRISKENAVAFNQLMGVIIHDYGREGKLSKLSKHIYDEQVIDGITKSYYRMIIEYLEKNKNNVKARENILKFHSLIYQNQSPAQVLTNDLYRDNNKCVNFRGILEYIVKNSKNKNFDFNTSALYANLVTYAKEVDKKYGTSYEL